MAASEPGMGHGTGDDALWGDLHPEGATAWPQSPTTGRGQTPAEARAGEAQKAGTGGGMLLLGGKGPFSEAPRPWWAQL